MCVELNACDTDGGYFTGFNKTKLDALKAIRVRRGCWSDDLNCLQ
jgi:hypothetical protein